MDGLKEWSPTLIWVVGVLTLLFAVSAQWGFLAGLFALGAFLTVFGAAFDLFGD